MTFLEAAKFILDKNDNKPMSSKEIWSEVEELNLVESGGKTPGASLNTILLLNSINTTIKTGNKSDEFIIVSNRPNKFRINNYIPKMSFLDAIIFVLNENNNIPMSFDEIWYKISSQKLIKTIGKTPKQSMKSIVYVDIKKEDGNFEKIENKYKLKDFIPTSIKKTIIKTLKENDFVTKDMLTDVMSKLDEIYEIIKSK